MVYFILISALSLWFCVGIGDSLVHGRDAKPGELPYVVRVRISQLGVAERYIAAGTLISTTRVLTTCDTVGFFVGDHVILYNVSEVTVSAGTVYRDHGGEHLRPSSSNHHRWCHLLASGTVLFNYGFFFFDNPGFTLSENLKPIGNTFVKSKYALEASYRFWPAEAMKLRCLAAGWGYPTLAFEDYIEPDFFNSSSTVLQVINMTLVPYEGPNGCTETTCKEFDDCLANIWEDGLVCAKAMNGGPCRNDLGAPLICEGALVGIHTNAQMCQDRGIPRHFSRTDLVYEYIFDVPAGDARSISSRDSFVFGNHYDTIYWPS